MSHRCNAVRELLAENREQLPRWFRQGEPKLFALQEVFWSATAELMSVEVLGQKPSTRIRAGRDRSILQVPPPFWEELRRELGLIDPEVRRRTAEVLRGWLLEHPTRRSDTMLRLEEPLPLALVLMTGVLERLGRHGIPLSFVLDLTELERVAYEDFAWVEVGEINAGALARQLLRRAFTRLGHNPDLLEIPYHSYWRKLRKRLDPQRHSRSSSPSPDLPANFLVEGLRTGAESPGPSMPATVPTAPRPRGEELGKLYTRLDEMQRSSPARLLPEMLRPLLIVPDEPAEALDDAAASADGLARDLVLACRTLLCSGSVELIGSPGELLELALPCSDFQLEGPAGSGRDISRGRFRVMRRGIRYLGNVVLPAKVAPSL